MKEYEWTANYCADVIKTLAALDDVVSAIKSKPRNNHAVSTDTDFGKVVSKFFRDMGIE